MYRTSCDVLLIYVLCHITFVYGGYLITTPRKWTPGTDAQLCVSLSVEPSETDALTVAVADGNETVVEKKISFTSRSFCSAVSLPSDKLLLKPELRFRGSILGATVNATRKLKIARKVAQCFVQTDKFLYMPSQTVHFRVLTVIGPLLHVSTEKYSAIWVETPSGSRIRQWSHVDNGRGLLHLNFTLSDEPEEGVYNIKVSTPYETILSRPFKVEDYALPRYEVTIDPPPYVLGITKVIPFKVCARYTFGQPVKGIATLTVDNNGWGENKATVEKEFMISGCKTIELNATELALNGEAFYAYSLNAKASVVEDGTKVVLEADKSSVKITRNALVFEDISTQQYHKPELPFVVEVKVAFPDESPALDEPMNVCVKELCKNFTTSSKGILKFAVPAHLEGAPIVKALNYGRIKSGSSWRSVMYESNFVKSIRTYHSPTNSSLVIALLESRLNCTSEQNIAFTLPVRFSAVNQTIASVAVQVVSKGQIQFFETFEQSLDAGGSMFISDDLFLEPPRDPVTDGVIRGSFSVPITLPKSVSPEIKILVWYARSDGEVVSDARVVDISPCLLNDVTFHWSTSKGRPGDVASISLKAEPLSICSYGVVDKSVRLLAPKEEFTIDTLLEVSERASVGQYESLQVNDFDYCMKKSNESEPLPLPQVILPQPVPVVVTEDSSTDAPAGAADSLDLTSGDALETVDVPALAPEPSPATGDDTVDSKPGGDAVTPNVRRKRSFGWRPYYSNDIDALHMFDRAGVFAISDLILETRPCNSHYVPYVAPRGSNSPEMIAFSSSRGAPAPKKRVHFPETWLWGIVLNNDGRGFDEQRVVLPDTVTEWVGSAVCVHPSLGVGISQPSSIITFRDFFVDLTLPLNAKRGEVFTVKISVFNYLNQSLPVKIKMVDSSEFDILSNDSAKVGSGERSSCIGAEDKIVHTIKIRPTVAGLVNITVDASVDINSLSTCGHGNAEERRDTIVKAVAVAHEGIPLEEAWSSYVCSTDLKEGEDDSVDSWSVIPPAEVVEGSVRGWISVAGDLMGPTIGNLGKLVKMPYGCGEQNMLNFAPNIYVLDYLKSSNQSDTDIEELITKHMEKGYQRELNYRHSDGSYSAFGERDEYGSTWLTAFVLKCFARAERHISIDENDLQMSRMWLTSLQLENGCFTSKGRVLHKGMKGGISGNDSPLLASFVLISLIEAGQEPSSRIVREALFCLKADNDTTPYSLAVKSYALALAKDPSAELVIRKLLDLADVTPYTISWKLLGKDPVSLTKKGKGLIVETAGYALLALLSSNAHLHAEEAAKIVKWINNRRNGQGGFISTQDTILALQALAAYETFTPQLHLEATLLAKMGTGEISFALTEKNRFLLQERVIPSFPTNVSLTLQGQGCLLAQGILRYNSPNPDPSDAFNLTVKTETSPDASCKTKRINACASYTLPDLASNMAIIEIDIMTGYIPDKYDLKHNLAKKDIMRYEVDGSRVMFYVSEFSAMETCVSFRVLREFEVDDAKNGTVTVYDYYKPEYSISKSYRLPPASECLQKDKEETENLGGGALSSVIVIVKVDPDGDLP